MKGDVEAFDEILRVRAERVRERSQQQEGPKGDPHLLFDYNGNRCAMPLDVVESLMRVPRMRPVPQMPASYMGVFDLRGHFVEAFCLETLLGETEPSGAHLLLTRMGSEQIGLRVGEVQGIQDLDPQRWTPLQGENWPPWLSATAPGPLYCISHPILWDTLTAF